ncbi:MAG TPA: glycosyltransferase [Thermoanaerobaculia bacterium]|nr:glycosyltransferase [Thermoanaerobaculia bacterium]
MKLAAVIAAYDEVANIGQLTRRLAASLASIPDCSWELVFAVEGEDGTHEELQKLAQEIGSVRILYRKEPAGLGAAYRRAFAAVTGDTDFVVTMDADLNHQPEEIPRLLAAARRLDCDVLVGSRFIAGSEVEGIPLWKRSLSGGVNSLMTRLYGLSVRDKTSGFRVYRAEVLRRVRYDNDDFAFLPELLIRASRCGYRLAEEPIHFRYRRHGESKMAFWPTSLSYLSLLRGALDPVSRATLLLLAIGVLVRVAVSFPSHKFPADADCVLPGLAALQVLRGHPAVFFGSLRIGAVGSYPLALLFLLFGASRTTLAAGPLLAGVLLLGAWYLFLRELLGARIALLALPFAAVASPAFTFWTYMPNGYPEILLLCAASLWLAARLGRGDESHLTLFALGATLGLGWWSSPQTLGCGVPALLWAMWAIWRRPGLARRWHFVPLIAAGALLGALPWIAFNIRYPLASLHDNFAMRPVSGLSALADNGRYLLAENIPEMLASTDPEGAVNRSNLAHRMLHVPTLVILAGAGCFSLLVAPLLRRRTAALERERGGGAAGAADPRLAAIESAERNAWPLLVLVLLANVALNLVSGAGGLRGLTVRYVLPLYLLVPAVLATSLARVAQRSRALAASLAGIVLAFNVAGTFWPWTEERRTWAANASGDERALRLFGREGVRAVLGSYWLVYPLNFLSKETILGIPLEPGTDYRKEAERLGRSPVRWALMSRRQADLTCWAGKAGLRGGEAAFPGAYALILPSDEAPPEPFRQRLVTAWEDCRAGNPPRAPRRASSAGASARP